MAPPNGGSGNSGNDDTQSRLQRVNEGDSDGNGHTTRFIPEWERPAEFMPLPGKRHRKSAWSWFMSTRPVAKMADYAQVEKRPVPAWVPTVIVGLSLAFLTNFGIFMAWKGGTDNTLTTLKERDKDLKAAEKTIVELKIEVDSLTRQRTELSQYVGELAMWSADVRTRIISTGRGRPVEVPPLPERNGRSIGP
jgi:hypothetical protein